MRILTHNFLKCHVRGCEKDNFPLKISDAVTTEVETDFSPEFVANIMCKLDWEALHSTASDLSIDYLPEKKPENPNEDEEFLKKCTPHSARDQH